LLSAYCSPREIEEVLHAHPAVVEAHVIGVPDELYGEQVMAWVRIHEDAAEVSSVEASLKDHCRGVLLLRISVAAIMIFEILLCATAAQAAANCDNCTPVEHLAHFKVPKYFHFTSDFPVTVTGKVRKVEMRDMARKILGLQQVK
jgi:fatty-acyl-CoA synthase